MQMALTAINTVNAIDRMMKNKRCLTNLRITDIGVFLKVDLEMLLGLFLVERLGLRLGILFGLYRGGCRGEYWIRISFFDSFNVRSLLLLNGGGWSKSG